MPSACMAAISRVESISSKLRSMRAWRANSVTRLPSAAKTPPSSAAT